MSYDKMSLRSIKQIKMNTRQERRRPNRITKEITSRDQNYDQREASNRPASSKLGVSERSWIALFYIYMLLDFAGVIVIVKILLTIHPFSFTDKIRQRTNINKIIRWEMEITAWILNLLDKKDLNLTLN